MNSTGPKVVRWQRDYRHARLVFYSASNDASSFRRIVHVGDDGRRRGPSHCCEPAGPRSFEGGSDPCRLNPEDRRSLCHGLTPPQIQTDATILPTLARISVGPSLDGGYHGVFSRPGDCGAYRRGDPATPCSGRARRPKRRCRDPQRGRADPHGVRTADTASPRESTREPKRSNRNRRALVSAERLPNMTVLRFHGREALAGTDLGLFDGVLQFWEAEHLEPSPVVVVIAPPDLLSPRAESVISYRVRTIDVYARRDLGGDRCWGRGPRTGQQTRSQSGAGMDRCISDPWPDPSSISSSGSTASARGRGRCPDYAAPGSGNHRASHRECRLLTSFLNSPASRMRSRTLL